MRTETLLHIALRINEVAQNDGVFAQVNFNPNPMQSMPSHIAVWAIELTYDNYHITECFNPNLLIDEDDVDYMASVLLKGLFASYFNEKLGLKT